MSKNVFGEESRLDLDRVNRDQTWLSGRASLPGQGGVALTPAIANGLYVQLSGANQALWIPNPLGDATQDITGHFNLNGAAFQYKITGRHALSMPGTGNLLAGEAAGAALVAGGNDNVLLGYQAGAALTTEDDNVIIGSYAGYTGAHASSVIVGYSAGATDAAESVLNTVLIGPYTWGAGSATDSVLIGASVLAGQDGGDDSTQDVIIGSGAAAGGNYNGYSNVILGYQAGNDVTTGRDNVLVGWRAADTLTEGIGNVIVGSETAYSLLGGNYNVVIGELAGIGLTSGSNNVILGQTAGQAMTTATGNVFLGYASGRYETGSNKLFIDNATRASEADARVKALVYGVFDAATANQYLTINGHLTVLEDAIVGGTTAAARLHVDQNSATGAAPVLLLDQADVSEEFVRFVGTAADDTLTQSIVAVADVSTATVAGYVKVYVVDTGDQITDQAYYMPIYTLA